MKTLKRRLSVIAWMTLVGFPCLIAVGFLHMLLLRDPREQWARMWSIVVYCWSPTVENETVMLQRKVSHDT